MRRAALVRTLAVLLLPVVLCGATWSLRPGTWQPHPQSDLHSLRVYAYRQWQSTGIKVDVGDRLAIRARGTWSYSPIVGPHGPEGGLPAPGYYPMPSVLGGALLGRIGENGERFYVGRQTFIYTDAPGLLYLRINDDLLGDNAGQLALEIEVEPPPATR